MFARFFIYKFHSRYCDDFVFKNTEQNKDSFELLTLGGYRESNPGLKLHKLQ